MNGFFGHLDAAPLFLGLILAGCILSLLRSFVRGEWIKLIVELGTWVVVFKTHPGVSSAIAASIAAFIVGHVFRRVVR